MALSANNKVSLVDLNALMAKIVTKSRSCACNCNFCTCNCNYCACHTNVCTCNTQCACQYYYPSSCGGESGCSSEH